MPFPAFDRSRLKLKPLSQRKHDLDLSAILPLDAVLPPFEHAALAVLAKRIVQAKERGAAVILMMGAHVLRAGVQRFLIDLMERRLITHIAMNGAGPIHDWELALVGATTESVARYIQTGEFGLWEETGRMNDVIHAAARTTPLSPLGRGAGGEGPSVQGLTPSPSHPLTPPPSQTGLGEALGHAMHTGNFPHKHLSLLVAGVRLGVPVTVHVGIGYDIIHEHPNCDGAALGQLSYHDFLVFAKSVENLEGGVLLNYGSAVMGPEVYLKALSMARNVAHQEGRIIRNFTTAAFDLVPLEGDFHEEAPKTDPRYYYRPWKTILVRTVADGGESFYVQGDHGATVPALWREVAKPTRSTGG